MPDLFGMSECAIYKHNNWKEIAEHKKQIPIYVLFHYSGIWTLAMLNLMYITSSQLGL
jgi:hypothetical protein